MQRLRLLRVALGGLALGLTTFACTDDPASMDSTEPTSAGSGGGTESAPTSGSQTPPPTAPTGPAGSGSSDGGTTTDEPGTTTGDATDSGDGPTPTLPAPIGECPEIVDGTVTFNPAKGTREARVWVDPAAAEAMDGPVVFYWYGTGGEPGQAYAGLGDSIETITAMGGVVVAPVHTNGGTFPWLEDSVNDFLLTDEVVGCLDQTIGIDARQIHSLGFSAGGLFTNGLSFGRSSYLASVAAYSGGGSGLNDGAFEDASNKFAALIFYGGPTDDVFGFNFEDSSLEYQQILEANGNFAALCNHEMGHTIPDGAGPGIIQFFLDHPFGTDPSPYAGGFPAAIPDYCAVP